MKPFLNGLKNGLKNVPMNTLLNPFLHALKKPFRLTPVSRAWGAGLLTATLCAPLAAAVLPPGTLNDGNSALPPSLADANSTAQETTAPELRPLLAVGVVEGRINLRHLQSGAVQATRSNDGFDEELRLFARSFNDGKADVAGRAAFFLKGKIRGDQLLTVAYDSDKATRERMFRDIQPEQFYPVYGDSSVRAFEAQSSQRFYLRIDDQKSYLLYGDVSTQGAGEARSLGQYSRSFTGVQEHFENASANVNGYVSRDALKQVIDEFPARGISGPYSVSNPNGLSNSERVEIITRDRNQPAVVLKSVPLARFVDYEFEPFSGRLLFKAPVPSLDANFNPVSVRVTYEVDQGGQKFWLGALDGQFKFNDALEIGGSWVEDHNPLAPYQLRSLNATAKLGPHTYVLAELAQSNSRGAAPDNVLAAGKNQGQGQRIELRHSDGDLNLRVHAGKTDAAFNNPAATLNGGRAEAGAKVQYALNEHNRLSAELLRSEDSSSHGLREGASLAYEHDFSSIFKLQLGVRQSKETLQAASASSVGIGALNNATVGSPLGSPSTITLSAPAGAVNASTAAGATPVDNTTLRARVTAKLPDTGAGAGASLYGEYEQDLHSAVKQAAALGGDYVFAERARLYGRHEFISSLSGVYGLNNAQHQRATVLGLDTSTPADGQLFSEYRLRDALAGRDAEAAVGLRNQWRIRPGLRLSTGFERLHTFAGTQHAATAVTTGIDYTADPLWKGSARLEARHDAAATTWLNTVSAARKLDSDWTLLARNLLSLADNKTTGDKLQDRFQLGVAYRDSVSNKSNALARYEFKHERDDSALAASSPSASNTASQRSVHIVSGHADRQLSQPLWLEGHVASKWLTERVDGVPSRYTAHQVGTRSTYDMTETWDLGLIANVLFTPGARSRQYGVGAETGYRLHNNLWLSVGYNFSGFSDKDLEGSESTSKGVFMRLRFKFDERLFSSAGG
jgi:large repetitive protein